MNIDVFIALFTRLSWIVIREAKWFHERFKSLATFVSFYVLQRNSVINLLVRPFPKLVLNVINFKSVVISSVKFLTPMRSFKAVFRRLKENTIMNVNIKTYVVCYISWQDLLQILSRVHENV